MDFCVGGAGGRFDHFFDGKLSKYKSGTDEPGKKPEIRLASGSGVEDIIKHRAHYRIEEGQRLKP